MKGKEGTVSLTVYCVNGETNEGELEIDIPEAPFLLDESILKFLFMAAL